MGCHQVLDILDLGLNVFVASIGVAPFHVASSRRKAIPFFESTNEFVRAFETIRVFTKLCPFLNGHSQKRSGCESPSGVEIFGDDRFRHFCFLGISKKIGGVYHDSPSYSKTSRTRSLDICPSIYQSSIPESPPVS
jgi:hypothetical protein